LGKYLAAKNTRDCSIHYTLKAQPLVERVLLTTDNGINQQNLDK